MIGNLTGRGKPHPRALCGQVREHPPKLTRAMGMPHQESVDRDAAHQRPAVTLGIFELLVKRIAHHVGELVVARAAIDEGDRKSTRLNSSH